jgi:arylamine N-acetyltransferase
VHTWQSQYLELLGLQREEPTLDYLKRLTRAHLSRVPFENITSILRRGAAAEAAVPPLDQVTELQAWRDCRGGGLCFEVTNMFGTLLAGLGFRTHAVLANISFVGSHQAVEVDVDGVRYLVDAGNGAPFFDPIPISANAVEVAHVGLAYRFRPANDQSNALIQDRLIDSTWQPFCTYDLAPASVSAREAAYQRHHVRGQSWVVDNVTLVRCSETEVWSLRDDRLNHFSSSGKSTSTIGTLSEYREVIGGIFGLPGAPLEQAQATLGLQLP